MQQQQKLKVNVESKDGKCMLTVRNGNDLVEVQDHSVRVYETNRLDQLVQYLGSVDPDYLVFYHSSGVVVLPTKTSYVTEPVATCHLQQSKQLGTVLNSLDRNLDVDKMEALLKRLRPYLDEAGMKLLLQCRDMTLQKVVNVKRQKTQSGDFLYHVEMKGAEGDWKPPEKIQFTIPLYKYHDHKFALVVDLYIDLVAIRGEDDKCTPAFRFECPTVQDDLDEIQRRAIDKMIQDLPGKRFWGSAKTVQMTDAWRHLSNVGGKGLKGIEDDVD